jgi:sugar/nucleoside kinase (ribokinase family)
MARFDVTIAGEVNLDLILYGLPTDFPPERELLADRMAVTLGGSSAIVAHNLAALGCRVGFQSKIARDDFGRLALMRLRESGVDVSEVRRIAPAQSGMTVILQHEQWRNMLTYPGSIADLSIEDLNLEYLADSRHFHLSSFYLQTRLQPDIAHLFRKLKSAGLTISMDTNDDPSEKWNGGLRDVLRYVDVFLPNKHEACKIAGTTDLEKALDHLSEITPLVVVKLGRDGAIARRGHEEFSCPPLGVTMVDAIGAGDSFDAGFIAEYLNGGDWRTCVERANIAGALSVTRSGGTEAFRDIRYLESFLREHAAVLRPTL